MPGPVRCRGGGYRFPRSRQAQEATAHRLWPRHSSRSRPTGRRPAPRFPPPYRSLTTPNRTCIPIIFQSFVPSARSFPAVFEEPEVRKNPDQDERLFLDDTCRRRRARPLSASCQQRSTRPSQPNLQASAEQLPHENPGQAQLYGNPPDRLDRHPSLNRPGFVGLGNQHANPARSAVTTGAMKPANPRRAPPRQHVPWLIR